jgi:hypothetical protein
LQIGPDDQLIVEPDTFAMDIERNGYRDAGPEFAGRLYRHCQYGKTRYARNGNKTEDQDPCEEVSIRHALRPFFSAGTQFRFYQIKVEHVIAAGFKNGAQTGRSEGAGSSRGIRLFREPHRASGTEPAPQNRA